MPRITLELAGSQNRLAFLDMLAVSEIGAAVLAQSDDGYNVLVGSLPGHVNTFPSYAAHPDIYNRALNSTAAGRYQLLYRWFAPYKAILKLPDFSPISQDLIALQQIRERGALPLIDAGQFLPAVQKCGAIWASLGFNNYGQPTNETAALQAAFVSAGGQLSVV